MLACQSWVQTSEDALVIQVFGKSQADLLLENIQMMGFRRSASINDFERTEMR